MRKRRPAQAGVTLIEMLVALSVSSLVGLAGFVLLESVTRTEAGVAGRLGRIALQDRAFYLFALDIAHAQSAVFEGALVLQEPGQVVTWVASQDGLTRSITFPDRMSVEQRVLDEAAAFESATLDVIVLRLLESDVWRQVRLPPRLPQ